MRCSWRAWSECWSRSRACWRRSSRVPPPTACECRSCSAASKLSAAAFAGDQELAVAVGAGDRTLGDADHGPAGLTAEPRGNARADFLVQIGVADNAALADLRGADFELRLDQGDEAGRGRGQRERRRQYHFEADEAGIADDAIQSVRNVGARKTAGVGPLEHD